MRVSTIYWIVAVTIAALGVLAVGGIMLAVYDSNIHSVTGTYQGDSMMRTMNGTIFHFRNITNCHYKLGDTVTAIISENGTLAAGLECLLH